MSWLKEIFDAAFIETIDIPAISTQTACQRPVVWRHDVASLFTKSLSTPSQIISLTLTSRKAASCRLTTRPGGKLCSLHLLRLLDYEIDQFLALKKPGQKLCPWPSISITSMRSPAPASTTPPQFPVLLQRHDLVVFAMDDENGDLGFHQHLRLGNRVRLPALPARGRVRPYALAARPTPG